MALPVTQAFKRYTELLEEFMRQKKQGPISLARFHQFEEAMGICKAGMAPIEREELDRKLEEQRVAIMTAENQVSFSVDTSQAPYTVPCPVCFAFALGTCMSKRREPTTAYPGMKFPEDARVLPKPHPERQVHWEKNPQMRVRAMK